MADDELPAEELEACLRVLESLVANPGRLAELEPERRRALLVAAGRVSRPTRTELVRRAKAFRRQDRVRQKAHDARLVENTALRNVRRAPVYVALPAATAASEPAPEGAGELLEPRSCYVCKAPFRRLHHFYDSMCPPCAELNYAKRFQSARLDGRVVLVTGARVKIGYQTALICLRAGARVVATTRFPHDAARRFAAEADYGAWSSRLQVHGLDLRHAPSVELFAQYLERTLARLDVIINNAAQTVRRPPGFYAHLIPGEECVLDELPAACRPILAPHDELRRALGGATAADGDAAAGLMTWHGDAPGIGLTSAARLSQLPCAPGDELGDVALFPIGRVDADLQQVDLRPVNSWRLTLGEVPTPELLEVHLVNAIAPFLLNSRLKPLMTRDRTDEKHIVNVSAMEAQFARKKKTDKHPHTNMAKAALNMMTRTSAPDYAADGIFMNSVDTGWVTDEDPMVHVTRKQRVHDFYPPLDVVDGAARVCDPLFTGLLTGQHPWGQFFKDYRPTEW